MIKKTSLPLILTLISGLSGCSQNGQDVSATLQSAFFQSDVNSITPERIHSTPYASIVAQLEQQPKAMMVLLWAEKSSDPAAPSLKWISANRELIVTRSGRIVKTVGIKSGSLVSINATTPDPLKLNLLKSATPKQWDYTISWQPGYHFNYSATSEFYVGGLVETSLITGNQPLRHVIETVYIAAIDQRYRNEYWLEPATGHVVSSIQHFYPQSPQIQIAEGKRYIGDKQ